MEIKPYAIIFEADFEDERRKGIVVKEGTMQDYSQWLEDIGRRKGRVLAQRYGLTQAQWDITSKWKRIVNEDFRSRDASIKVEALVEILSEEVEGEK